MLAIITFRPEFVARWTGYSWAPLVLNRLSRASGYDVENVTSDKALPREVSDQIVAKTDGVPLFVEELTKTVLNQAAQGRSTGTRCATASLAIPATLQESLAARPRPPGTAKEVADRGSLAGGSGEVGAVAAQPSESLGRR